MSKKEVKKMWFLNVLTSELCPEQDEPPLSGPLALILTDLLTCRAPLQSVHAAWMRRWKCVILRQLTSQ